MATISVPNEKQIMRWMQGLRFARSEEDQQVKAANIKIRDADETHGKSKKCGANSSSHYVAGFVSLSVGSEPEHLFKFFCNDTMVQEQIYCFAPV